MEQEQEDDYIDKSSEIGKLILSVSQLEKRPTLDNSLGEILDSFLRALIRSEDFLMNGIFQINFAESAILLQSSTLIYSKKVDLLWDSINECQKRLISYKKEEHQDEMRRIEERERKYKRRRKQIEAPHNENTVKKFKSFKVDWNDMNNFQHCQFEKDSKLYSGWYKKMVMKWDLQPTPKTNKSLADKQIQFRSNDNAIFDQDHDNEFVVYTSKMESVIGLQEMLLPEKLRFPKFTFHLYAELNLIPKFLRENNLSYEDLEKHSVEMEKYVENYKDLHFQRGHRYDDNYCKTNDRQTPQKLRRISISSTIMSRVDMSELENIYIKTCQVNLLRLSVDDLSRMSRLSVDEVKKFSCSYDGDDSKLENFQEHFSTENKVYTGTADSSPQNTGGKDVDINISASGKSLDSSECTEIASACEEETSSFNETLHPNHVETSTEKSIKLKVSSSKFNETTENVEKTRQIQTRKAKIMERIETADDYENPPKRRKLSKVAMRKLATGITVDLEKFNAFFEMHYQPEEGEGAVEIPEFTFDDPIDSSSIIDVGEKAPSSQLSDHPILCTQDSGYESHFQETPYLDDTSVDDMTSPLLEIENLIPEELLQQNSSINEAQGEDGEKPLYQRVYEWKEFMSEKFKHMKSADFDIHEYGSNIMESFVGDHPQKFGNIVRGKSSAEVTRFFISALQLANTSNVEIQGVQSGELSNKTFELKLISKERYYDRLKDYLAPSEQDYHKRLSSAQKMHKKRSFPSSSGNSCSFKKKKYQ